MAGAGLFQMAPYQWTDTAGLSMRGLELAGKMAAAHDKKVKQTTTTKKSGGSGLGGALGSVVGGVAGSFFGPAGTMIGSSLGGALGGGIEGGSAGAAAGLAGGLGMGTGMAGSDTFMNSMGGMWDNLGLKSGGQQGSGRAGSSGSAGDSGWGMPSIGDSYKLKLQTQPLGLF